MKRSRRSSKSAPAPRTASARAKRKTTSRGAKTRARAARRPARAAQARHVPTKGLYGWITHTELVSTDPAATKAWCAAVLGWTFKPSLRMPEGEYHLFAYAPEGGGGIRQATPSEAPGSRFSVHVADTQQAFDSAIRQGAEAILQPTRVMDGVTIAVVRAPGGVPVGLSGP